MDSAKSLLPSYEWQSEKHGKGPRHYHAAIGEHHLEIYPLRKRDQDQNKTSLEFYFDLASVEALTPEMGPQNGTVKLLKDPEGRTFIVGLPQEK